MMSNSDYSIGLQRLKPVHTAYGAICMPIRKLDTRRKWSRRDETLVRLETVSRPRRRDRDHNPGQDYKTIKCIITDTCNVVLSELE